MKKRILEEMAREVVVDASKVAVDAINLGSRAIKGGVYWLTTPLIGMLSEEAKSRIYSGKNELVKKATYISLVPALFSYPTLLDETGFHRLAIGAFLYGLLENGFRLVNVWPGKDGEMARRLLLDCERGSSPSYYGTLLGYVPSKIIAYIGNKYDSAKAKVEGGQE
jgi:hypothetical protein